jgi:prepilin peptidase CpaA
MLAAAIEDVARYRISNVTTLIILAGAVAAAVIEGPSIVLWQNLVVFVVILVLGTAAFSAGWLGGGDVKLFAAAGLWLDFRSAVGFVALVFLAGGLVAIAYLLSRPLRRKAGKGAQIPYGIAIAIGMTATILLAHGTTAHHQWDWRALNMPHNH